MSFSSDVKKELAEYIPTKKCCAMAELYGMMSFASHFKKLKSSMILNGNKFYKIKKFTELLKVVYGILPEVSVRWNSTTYSRTYEVSCKLNFGILKKAEVALMSSDCCKRAFLRGAFLEAGSIGDPEKGYHFEIVSSTKELADKLIKLLDNFGIKGKFVKRKNTYPVYFKESESIVDFLGITQATVSLLRLENVRIYKEVKNNVNRTVNYETANIKKTALAAVQQLDSINYLKKIGKLEYLPIKLKELAEIRLENPEATLKELGELLDPPLTKSGVNHRLKKIDEIAEERRKK